MAFSNALIRMLLSMPFSLLTCSMTRLRSCCILRAPVVLVIGFLNGRERNLNGRSVLFHCDLIRLDVFEHSQKRTAAIDLLAGANANALTDKTCKMLGGFERTVNAGRRNFECIRAGNHILAVQAFAQMAADPGQVVDVRAA